MILSLAFAAEGSCDAEVGLDGVVLWRGLGMRAAAVEQGGSSQVA